MSKSETIIRDPKEFGDRLLYLKNQKKYCDVEIIVGEERILVHKNIIASSCEYFEATFNNGRSVEEISVEDMDLEIVQSLLDYCYTGSISVTERNLRKIMQLAKAWQMTSIIKGCEKILINKMDSSNCISTWKLANSGYFKNLGEVAFECIKQNFEKASKSPEFLDLNYSEIKKLLSSDIIVANEMTVFESVRKWINRESRKQHLNDLLHYIKFEYIPGNVLNSEFQSFCNNNLSSECLNKIINAQRWKDNNISKPFVGIPRDSYNTLMVVNSNILKVGIIIEIYDLRSEKWIQIKKIEKHRYTRSEVLLEHKLMLIGGQFNYDFTAVNRVESYDLKTGTVEELPPMKYKRFDLTAVEFKGRVYAIGGANGVDNLAFIEMWDPVLKTWNELAPMLIPRKGCEASILNDEIFVAGGINNDPLSDVESYNPITDKWTKRASMNEKRVYFGMTAINGYLYVAGGNYKSTLLRTAEKYDSQIDKWTSIQSLETYNMMMAAGNLFGKLVVIYTTMNHISNPLMMKMYDDENNTWIPMSSLSNHGFYVSAFEIPWHLAMAILAEQVPN